ncbi:GPI biosynthesis protein Pig-F [Spinellus fusiger]|nr:GPI biosynthesis protein Pig-F [Spinellus fusiger]
MNSLLIHSLVAFLGVLLDTMATFHWPDTKLMQEPVETLATAVPILLLGHALLLLLALYLKGSSLGGALSTTGCALVTTAFTTLILHMFTVLFGAPLLAKFYNTLVFSAYLSILSVMPTFAAIVTPQQSSNWSKVLLQHCPTTTPEIYGYTQAICTLSGAWIGAIVLPLDWDREWQAWPISCVISTYLGHTVGVLAGFGWSSIKLVFEKKKTE